MSDFLSRPPRSQANMPSHDPRLPTWWLVVAALLIVVVVGGLAVWLLLRVLPEAVDPTWERILETGELRVCTDPSWPPFEFIDEGTGELRGFDLDLARHLADRLGWAGEAGRPLQAKMVTVGFDSLYDALLSGRCDVVVSALPYEAMRVEDVSYSVAYFNAGLVLVVGEETEDIEVLEDVEDRVVGVEWGFVPEGDVQQKDLLRNLPLRRYDTAGDALRALQSGEVEAAIVDRVTALAYMRDCEGLKFVDEPLFDLNYVIPVRPESFRLREEIDRALLDMRDDGTLETLQDRWF
jgi:polar amino acid transport system substrate-binding protein